MAMRVEQTVEFMRGENEVLGEKLSQFRFVNQKSRMT
jgi:hypothetical protein